MGTLGELQMGGLPHVLMATEALGPAYERLDLSSVDRGE